MRAGERGMRCDAIIGRSGSEGLTYFRHPSTSSSSFTKCSAQCTQWLVSQTCLQSCRDSVYTSRLAPPPNPFDFRSQDQVQHIPRLFPKRAGSIFPVRKSEGDAAHFENWTIGGQHRRRQLMQTTELEVEVEQTFERNVSI